MEFSFKTILTSASRNTFDGGQLMRNVTVAHFHRNNTYFFKIKVIIRGVERILMELNKEKELLFDLYL